MVPHLVACYDNNPSIDQNYSTDDGSIVVDTTVEKMFTYFDSDECFMHSLVAVSEGPDHGNIELHKHAGNEDEGEVLSPDNAVDSEINTGNMEWLAVMISGEPGINYL